MKRLGHAIALACLCLLPGRLAAAEWTADIADMDWSPPRFIAVDKNSQAFWLLSHQSPLRILAEIPCTTGQELGDKFKEGDLKTPEGVYFITRRKATGLNFELYGDLAFPLNFPNPVDVLHHKSGHGIWIHGRGHAITPYETQGCVALSLPDIHRMDQNLAEGMPVVIADEVHLGGKDAAKQREEAREVVADTRAWAKAWQDKSSAFFDFHDPEKFSITEGQPFAAFRSHKERLFKLLPWIKVDLSDVRAIAGPDYWVTYFIQLYRSPTLISKGIKRLYWQRGMDGRFRIVGMEYEEMPVTLAEKGKGYSGKPASPDEVETDTRKPDTTSEEEVQVRQVVDAHQAVMEKMAQKAFSSLSIAPQATPEDEAILEVAKTGAVKPGVSPFATDAMRPSPPPESPILLAETAKAHGKSVSPVSPPPPASVVAAHAAKAVSAKSPAQPAPAVVAANNTPKPAASPASKKPEAAPKTPTVPVAAAPAPAINPSKPAEEPATGRPATVTPAQAAQIATLVDGWRSAWEDGRIDAYMEFYAAGARQGNLRGKEAIRRQKEGVWRGREPNKIDMQVVAAVPVENGFEVACAETYKGKGGRESKGFKRLLLVPEGGRLVISQERWSREKPELAAVPGAAVSKPGSTPVAPAVAVAPPAPKTPVNVVPSVPVAPQPTPPAMASTPTPAPATQPVPSKKDQETAVAGMVETWRKTWEQGNPDAYAAFYAAKAVQGDRHGREDIRDEKVQLWKNRAPKRVALSNVKIRPRKDGYVVTCVQDYASRDGGTDRGLKTLYLAPSDKGFVIVEEKWSRL